jgi:ketosteroid isomerase-like protein
MKSAFAIASLVALCLSAPVSVSAQELASETLRAEISEQVQKLVAAANAGDADAFFALTSNSPQLVIAGDGKITRGLTDVRANMTELFKAHEQYKWKVEAAEVFTAGSNVAIALAPIQFTAVGSDAAVQLTGAITVVFARDWFWQDYKVVHSHRSTGRIGVAVVD